MRKNIQKLTDRQMAVLTPHIQRAIQIQRELSGVQVELNNLILSYTPPQYEEVKLDTSIEPWTIFVDVPDKKPRATAKARKK